MSERTVSSMHDARDAEDNRLLEAKEHTQLLENYVYLVQEWVSLRVRNREAADEVVQRVFERLARELAAGKTYPVPFRVVVWNVVNWKARGYEWTPKFDAELPEHWDDASSDEIAEAERRYDLGLLFDDLPPGDREVMRMRYLDDLSPEQIADRLGKKRNAIDQAIHRGHRKVREKLVA